MKIKLKYKKLKTFNLIYSSDCCKNKHAILDSRIVVLRPMCNKREDLRIR